ncbi:uncharacterized protein FA14DRAFT_185300 [Meira miltonrushii]|uniref:SWIM-type domain-containing protein n=1 Tax=Meira miltonrushii TaxID=1280837 RepID=A0A316V7S1_9BASI|nr:uncharacterized protein FA14DRAFT_185300 [Meira miltonrushii]PWN33657.1 hypothetical protein FA14DRAFT_185300 [Meira miltonrushii]
MMDFEGISMDFQHLFKGHEEEVKHEMTDSVMYPPATESQVTSATGNIQATEISEASASNSTIADTVAVISAAAISQDATASSESIATEPDVERNASESLKNESKPSKTRSTAQSSPKKGVKRPKVEIEKRGAKFRPKPSIKAMERNERVNNQRMFLLHREREQTTSDQSSPSSSNQTAGTNIISEEFVVTGSTGYVYTVNIDQNPRCNCPDWKKHDGNPCKHTMFVFLRVLGVNKDSHLWYQKCLLSDELRQIFANARPDPATSNSSLRSAYLTATYGIGCESDDKTSKKDENRRLPQNGDLCPICYEEFEEGMTNELIFCQAFCGNPLHKKCAIEWAKSMGKPLQEMKCIYCRGLMAKPTKGKGNLKVTTKGEYMNVGGYRSGFYGDR